MHRYWVGDRLRRVIQVICAAVMNGYIAGFASGKIYKGPLKAACVPVLNCWSCPGALAGCPIGALQNTIGAERRFPFYTLGFLLLIGVFLGRLVCGFVCPFGLLQDLIAKIPVKKFGRGAWDARLKYLKYVILAVFVVLLPALLTPNGIGKPYFCELICPAGTLEAGLPLVSADPALRALTGGLFAWKVFVLAAVIIACVFIPRAFCRYICPLGAFYSFFNRFALFKMAYDKAKCTRCLRCVKACPMGVDVIADINSPECIRCMKCRNVCPEKAIRIRN